MNLPSSGAIETSSLPSSESGSISVKSENSNPGATEQPSRTVSDMGSAACQIPAGITWQKVLLTDDRVMHLGGVLEPSQVYRRRPVPWYRFQTSSDETLWNLLLSFGYKEK